MNSIFLINDFILQRLAFNIGRLGFSYCSIYKIINETKLNFLVDCTSFHKFSLLIAITVGSPLLWLYYSVQVSICQYYFKIIFIYFVNFQIVYNFLDIIFNLFR